MPCTNNHPQAGGTHAGGTVWLSHPSQYLLILWLLLLPGQGLVGHARAEYPLGGGSGGSGGPGEAVALHHGVGARQCQAIRVAPCQDVGYNFTLMPNLVGHENQAEAEYRFNSFKPLIQYGCSSQLQFFLCTMYVPMCSPLLPTPTPIGPCRPMCETVRDRCSPVLSELGYSWPPALNCSKLPQENNEDHMCMEGPGELNPAPPTPVPPPKVPTHAAPRCSDYVHAHNYRYINATGVCAPLCQADVSFSREDKAFAGVWMGIWAVVCFCVTLFTVLSFIIEAAAFRYPERALVHLCWCYNLVSLGYLVRLAAGGAAVSCHADPELGVGVLVTPGGPLHATCALVFLLLYYFTTAASVWWVMLCVSWLLRAWRGWTHEQILRHSSWFHVAAWGLPAAQAIVALLLRKVDADELTGTCYVGMWSVETLVRLVLVPQFLYLVTGATLVLIAFACLWRARTRLKQEGLKTDRVDVTAARMGVVAVLYMVPATCQVGATFYEFVEREQWLHDAAVRPNMEVFMLKIFMSLAVGIMGGLFLVNARALNAWRQLFNRLTKQHQPPKPYLLAPSMGHVGQHHHSGKGAVVSQQHYLPAQQHHHLHGSSYHQPTNGSNALVGVHGGGGGGGGIGGGFTSYNGGGGGGRSHKHHHSSHGASRNKCGSETQV